MRRFALVFVAACSTSFTGATSSPLESASIDVDAERTCACAEVTVRCSGVGDAAGHARADRAACVLDLPAKSCALLGLVPDSKIDPEEILALPLPTDVKGHDVWEVCTAKHEARHACDGKEISACTSELDAYDVTLECMSAYADDDVVSFNVEDVVAARELNECLCEGELCAACVARCHTGHPTRDATCEQAASVYCP